MGEHRAGFAAALLGACLACVSSPGPAIPPSQLTGNLREVLHPDTQEVLRSRMESDSTLREWLEDHGPPDYLALESERSVVLFYVARDLEVHFRRPFLQSASEPPGAGRIRAHHHRFFSDDDRARLGDLRRERARQEERARRRRSFEARRDRSSEPPAAPED